MVKGSKSNNCDVYDMIVGFLIKIDNKPTTKTANEGFISTWSVLTNPVHVHLGKNIKIVLFDREICMVK